MERREAVFYDDEGEKEEQSGMFLDYKRLFIPKSPKDFMFYWGTLDESRVGDAFAYIMKLSQQNVSQEKAGLRQLATSSEAPYPGISLQFIFVVRSVLRNWDNDYVFTAKDINEAYPKVMGLIKYAMSVFRKADLEYGTGSNEMMFRQITFLGFRFSGVRNIPESYDRKSKFVDWIQDVTGNVAMIRIALLEDGNYHTILSFRDDNKRAVLNVELNTERRSFGEALAFAIRYARNKDGSSKRLDYLIVHDSNVRNGAISIRKANWWKESGFAGSKINSRSSFVDTGLTFDKEPVFHLSK